MSEPIVSLPSGEPSAAEPLLRTLIRASPLAIYLLDSDGRIQLWNPAAERIFGWCEREVLGRPDPTPGDVRSELNLLKSVIATGDAVEQDVVRLDRDGNPIDIALSLARVTDDVGGTRGVMAVAADITARRRLERERDLLLELERTARVDAEAAERRASFLAETSAMLDGSLDYHATLDNLARLAVPALADYCLIDELEGDSVCRVAVAHVDPEREKILYRNVRQPLAGDPEKHPVLRVLLTGKSVYAEVVDEGTLRDLAHSDHHLHLLRELRLHSFLVVPLSSCGKIHGAITLAYAESGRQYTTADLKMVEELARRAGIAVEAARLYRESRLAVQARERLMAIVSHDLRNSLATVLLNASSILESPATANIDSSVRDQLQWIERSTEQMNRLISDLLDVSAIELGRLSLDPSPQPVACLMRDVTLMHQPLCADRQIEFVIEVPPDIPTVFIDPQRFLQVVGNLVGNAIKFSPPGSCVRLVAAIHDDGEVRFSVSDEGPGIDESVLPTLFEMYRQNHSGRRVGAGLGLGIARAIVEALGGRIWADSTPGAGSTFTFTVPTRIDPGAAHPEARLL